VNNLIFFNKEGFPHNFQYNQDTEGWEGKIIFDENSDQTFKTKSLHIFETVQPIEFDIDIDFVELIYNNNSGLTIIGETDYQLENINDIKKVNESSNFNSKWIYGEDFHKKFPIGTTVSFSGVSHSDFDENEYFNVLNVKKDAFLIVTNTSNDIFDFTFISGTTSSINMISINDYNRNLSGETFFQNLYNNKKLSIVNSTLNDKLISIKQSGTSTSYLNDIKLNGTKDQNFTLKVTLLTERPKVLQHDVTLTANSINFATIEVGKFARYLAPETIYNSDGSTSLLKKEIIFEDQYNNKLFSGITFNVESLIDEKYIGEKIIEFKQYYKQSDNYNYYKYDNLYIDNQWNTIQYNGILDINIGDIVVLSGIFVSGETGSTFLMNNREFRISDVKYSDTKNITILFTPGYIIDESNNRYSISKKLSPHQITSIYAESSGDITDFDNLTLINANCFLTSNILNFSQTYVSGTTEDVISSTIDTFINTYKIILYQYGIDAYHTIKNDYHYLSIESLYGTNSNYFIAQGYTNGIEISNDFTFSTQYNIITNEILYNERTNRISDDLYKTEVSSEILLDINDSTNNFAFRLTLNNDQYFANFSGDTPTTIDNFINYYNSVFISNGFIFSRDYNTNYSGYTLNITTDVDIYNLEMVVNILSTYQIIRHNRNKAILLSGNEIHSNIVNLFYLGLSTGMLINVSGSTFEENNKEYNIISLTENIIGLSYNGVFESETGVFVNFKTREFIRKPRSGYNKDVYYRAHWELPYDDTLDDSIFFYDITGEQLKYNETENVLLTYNGKKPLVDNTNNIVILNDKPNDDLSKISNPKYQQTIFDDLTFKLEQLDSSESYNYIPEPLEIFIGYNSPNEGLNSKILKIEKIEKNVDSDNYLSYTGYTNSGSSISISNFRFENDTIYYNAPIDFSFSKYGFEKDQIIKFYFKDQNEFNQIIFENYHKYKLKNVYRNKLIIDTDYTYNTGGYDTGKTYSSGFTYFNSTGNTFFFKIEVQPKDLLYCPIYGQTENENIRYKVNLNNLGIRSEEDVYQILYDSDIQDFAIDYTLFNRKRKEMLTTFKEIYNYIGSYKSLINAINYFGYNDLQLYEYYSGLTNGELHKVLIPDIFDNSVEGWNEIDFISDKFQNLDETGKVNYIKTNLFNLTYRITDEEGLNTLIYTLDEVQYKLTKLKKWLRQNIIPLSSNLLDITGVADTTETLYQNYDESNQTIKSVVERKSNVVNFNYTATLNFKSNYLITVNFYTLSGSTDSKFDEIPESFTAKIKTFYLSGNTILNPTEILVPVQYFKLNKNDLKPFSFNIDKKVDPYIYIETTTYSNDGSGLGYVNNKLFYYDEPRNFWIVNNNFDLTKMKYWQTTDYIYNKNAGWLFPEIEINDTLSTIVPGTVETIVHVNTLNKTYLSEITANSSKLK